MVILFYYPCMLEPYWMVPVGHYVSCYLETFSFLPSDFPDSYNPYIFLICFFHLNHSHCISLILVVIFFSPACQKGLTQWSRADCGLREGRGLGSSPSGDKIVYLSKFFLNPCM